MFRRVYLHSLLLFVIVGFLRLRLSVSQGVDDGDAKIYYPSDETKYEGSLCETSAGLRGICRKHEDCPDATEKQSKSDLCSFNKNIPVYCCALDFVINADVRFGDDENNDGSAVGNTQRKKVPPRPVEQICNRYYSDVREEEKKKSNGDTVPTTAQSLSYMVGVGWKDKNDKVDWNCTGVVLTKKIILSDAQCIKSRSSLPNVIKVTTTNSPKKLFNISTIFIHPDFKASEVYHNLALIKINPDISITKLLRPACLWHLPKIPNAQLTKLGFSDQEMKQVHAKNISRLDNETCSRQLGKSLELPSGVTAEIFCSDDKDKCENDSGEFIRLGGDAGSSGRPLLVGITSYGQYCNESTPVVHTQLSSYLDWIEPILIREV
ncbi:serine protease snake-like [Hermetia illucens]|uniref:serine protease snake-like n=1 Tax=Hermetia illucens TaxID=343691 RepID=UPI0018CC73B7|nr:serine protease snake-like [Hermetia illucens]